MLDPGYLAVRDLGARGWTKASIRRYLGPHDCLFPVDH